MDASGVAVVPIFVMVMFGFAGSASADPPPTQQITTIAVGSQGQAVNGYRETPPVGNVAVVNCVVDTGHGDNLGGIPVDGRECDATCADGSFSDVAR